MSTSSIAFGIGTTAASLWASWIVRERSRTACPNCHEPLADGSVCHECGIVWGKDTAKPEKRSK